MEDRSVATASQDDGDSPQRKMQTMVTEMLRNMETTLKGDKPTATTALRKGEEDAKGVRVESALHETSIMTVKSFLERKFTLTTQHAALDVVVSSQALLDEMDLTALPITTLLEESLEQTTAATFNKFHSLALLQINSRALVRVINRYLSHEEQFTTTNKAWAHLAPFKTLCRIQKQLRQHLKDLHAKYGMNTGGNEGATSSSETVPVHSAFSNNAYLDLIQLLSFFDRYIRPWYNNLRSAAITEVSFDDLTALYQPGDLVVVPDSTQRVYRVAGVSGGCAKLRHVLNGDTADELSSIDAGDTQNYGTVDQLHDWHQLVLVCYFVKYDGSAFVRQYRTFKIKPYRRPRDVKLNRPYPERLTTAKFREQRWEEGLRFYSMTDPANRPAFYKYKGRTLIEDFEGITLTQNGSLEEGWRDPPLAASDVVDADVVVDLDIAILNRPKWAGGYDEMITELPNIDDTLETAPSPNVFLQDRHIWDDQQFKAYSAKDLWLAEQEEEDTKDKEHRELFKARDTERSKQGLNDSILLLPGRVFGYLLRDREWTCFDLSSSATWTAIQEDDSAWRQMQINESHRRNLVALVARHFKNREHRRGGRLVDHVDGFDLIQGKGRGLVILLHGAPGVGKTSTAESIAARFGKPLLPITCGNLGTNVYRVEYELKEHFSLAEKWGCVVLLDEADVFLARREKSDIDRNALVSIFLNTLEYFSGVLFLTTNRTGDFDEAFTSRIHVSLWYPDLDMATTRKIWQNDIDRLMQQQATGDGTIHVESGEEILRYAEKHCEAYKILQRSPWNGRQIRNAFQTAVALAEFEAKEKSLPAPTLNWTHFRKVAIASNHFEGYLTETRGKNEDELAKEFSLRARFNAYAGIHGDDMPRMHEVKKWKKISLYKAHEFIKSIGPDTVVEPPPDLFEAELENSINKALRVHKQPIPAQQPAFMGTQQYVYPQGSPMLVPGQQILYPPGMPQRPLTPSGMMQQPYSPPMQQPYPPTSMQQTVQPMQYQQGVAQPLQYQQEAGQTLQYQSPQYQQQSGLASQPAQPQYQGSSASQITQINGMMHAQSLYQDSTSQIKTQTQA
ncbi:hypothetical protein AMS68_006868 [Peltaster fructicola]|uniref:AAA+ ATPase domain-containing protein n=1 Tax=Peltaster fructicola TaxID=286661 RepID=A0A6H0Y371_9PEZI|nr:hypothetical protein AMS68_006868 [Peltaster fructicola]